MTKNDSHSLTWQHRVMRKIAFPTLVLAIYGILFAIAPVNTSVALRGSGNIFLHLMVPLSLVFILMLALNLFLKPAHIVRFLGRGAGIKGAVLSAAAGIISTGPIYAWYPLLKELREKGAANSFVAIFLGNRAVKPFLLPIMISYFSWFYVLVLTVFTVVGSIVAGYSVGRLVKERNSLPSRYSPSGE